ncbi:MAG TPA: AIR synthase related protein [Dehalococcoidia bacterium]|nr:AIR synthase related protein [Dehalococcoidia bacterium]
MTLPAGKLRADLLAEMLATVRSADSRVLLGPGIGRDAAVLDVGGGRALVATTDPVTFAVDEIGRYAVNVNANDIACMGAQPAWFLATVLLPPGTEEEEARAIFGQITQSCSALGIELVGGHTEVTLGLTRPIVCGTMLGEGRRDRIVMGRGAAPGDAILLTKGIAIEGTALLALESPAQLSAAGVSADAIERAAGLLRDPGVSIVSDAKALCSAVRPRALHDPTEGGLATALWELAEATGATLRVDPDAIYVYDETRIVCTAVGVDPMGLLASGALLAVTAGQESGRAIQALADVKIACRAIGTIEAGPPRVILGAGDSTRPLGRFPRDEIARFYEGDAGEWRH